VLWDHAIERPPTKKKPDHAIVTGPDLKRKTTYLAPKSTAAWDINKNEDEKEGYLRP
jgi:hypothetical protein